MVKSSPMDKEQGPSQLSRKASETHSLQYIHIPNYFWHNTQLYCIIWLSTKMTCIKMLNVASSPASSLSIMVVLHLLPLLIIWQSLIQPGYRNHTDLSHNKHEPLLTCLETKSDHLMTAHTKQTAECKTCVQFCSCLGLYSNKHHQFYSTDVLIFFNMRGKAHASYKHSYREVLFKLWSIYIKWHSLTKWNIAQN